MTPCDTLHIERNYEDAPDVIYEVRNSYGDFFFSSYDIEECKEYIRSAA